MLHVSRSRSRVLAAGALALLAAGIFALPYALPVPPSVSQSYVTGFNNRAALIAFLLCGGLLAALTDGILPPSESDDSALPRWTLLAVMAGTFLICLVWRVSRQPVLGVELAYNLERQIHLDHGEHLYRDFEYIYGPLLIYPGHLVTSLLKVRSLTGYLVSWMAQWLAGMTLIWFVVANTDLRTSRRWAVLLFLLAFALTAIASDGTNYAPLRAYTAAALSLGVFLFWRRHQRPYATAAMAVLAIGVGLLVSPEQGVGLGFGLSAYGVLLSWSNRQRFPVAAAVLIVLGAAAASAAAAQVGVFGSLRALARGGYNFPLLPSGPNLFLLGTYLCGLGLLYRFVRRGELERAAVPLALCGVPMLASAFGRCDTGHLASASPLLLVGVLGIAGHRRLFWGWLLLGVAFLLPIRPLLSAGLQRMHPVERPSEMPRSPGTAATPSQPIPPGKYFAPIYVPVDPNGRLMWSAESGFYFGLWNVISPERIQAKAAEITEKRAARLLLPDSDGQMGLYFWPSEQDLEQLHKLESAPWVPKAKHALPSLEPIRRAILQAYTPTNEAERGWRVWKLR